MAELKPCPFCGGEGMIGAKYRYHYPTYFIVVCRKCGAMAHCGKTMEEAAKKWNRRTEPPESEVQDEAEP